MSDATVFLLAVVAVGVATFLVLGHMHDERPKRAER